MRELPHGIGKGRDRLDFSQSSSGVELASVTNSARLSLDPDEAFAAPEQIGAVQLDEGYWIGESLTFAHFGHVTGSAHGDDAFVMDADHEDWVYWGGCRLTGGVQSSWMEAEWGYWTPPSAAMAGAPGFLGNILAGVMLAADLPAMLTFRYGLSDSGQHASRRFATVIPLRQGSCRRRGGWTLQSRSPVRGRDPARDDAEPSSAGPAAREPVAARSK